MEISNIDRLQKVAEGLGELNDRITYVGGSVTGLYPEPNEANVDSHQTMDVDCVVEYFSFQEKEEFERLLRQRGFREDIEGGVICRWIYKGLQVDIMPSDEKYYNFTNRWYTPGIQNRNKYVLPNNRAIYIMSAPYFVATKIEAINGRAGDDYRGSTDFEDVVYILNFCKDFCARCKAELNRELKIYLSSAFSKLLLRTNLREEVECSLPLGEEERTDYVINIMRTLSEMNE